MKQLTYCINRDEGTVYSRCADKVAVPVLQFDRIGRDGDFTQPLEYELEQFSVFDLIGEWKRLKWTKKILLQIKNQHRQFWGMKPLKVIHG